MSKYRDLVAILDGICQEAMSDYPKYFKLSTQDEIQSSRCRAYIHLLLKVRFGLLELKTREYHVTDGSNDGGIDAYYIDEKEHVIYLIQSKFRLNEVNYESKEISYDELLAMDITRILQGHDSNEKGVRYNGKIQHLQRDIRELGNITDYEYKIIILANLASVDDSKIKRLIGDFPYEVYDAEWAYDELVFPIVSGTNYKQDRLTITLSLKSDVNENRIKYRSTTANGDCTVNIMFVPTSEIGKVLYQYKNTILRFNPRSYLGLEKNPINANIKNSLEQPKTNEFALLNNGITMLADEAKYSDCIGIADKAQLSLINPQIINGGQTAFTLSKIYEKVLQNNDLSIFEGKEVLLRVISFDKEQNIQLSEEEKNKRLLLIEQISNATNQQTEVEESDRRSNSVVLIELQRLIFKDFGYYFERKQGEYADGLFHGYISNEQVINKETFIRCIMALKGRPSKARQMSSRILFRKTVFEKLLPDARDYKRMMFAYLLSDRLTPDKLKKNSIKLYARYAIVYVASLSFQDDFEINAYEEKVDSILTEILGKWENFETYVQSVAENKKRYFKEKHDEASDKLRVDANWQGYYKGVTLNNDLYAYFVAKKESRLFEQADS